MWTSYEIKQVQAMYEKLEEETLEDILPSDLIEVIKEDYGKAYMNIRYRLILYIFNILLRNHYFEPKHKRGFKTLRFVRLMNDEFNPGTFLKQLIPHLTVGIDIEINVGFSFMGVQHRFFESRYSYFFAAQDLCSIKGIFHKQEEAMDFAEELQKKDYGDFLQETFLSSESGERFTNSGIDPFCLVACYIWISK